MNKYKIGQGIKFVMSKISAPGGVQNTNKVSINYFSLLSLYTTLGLDGFLIVKTYPQFDQYWLLIYSADSNNWSIIIDAYLIKK